MITRIIKSNIIKSNIIKSHFKKKDKEVKLLANKINKENAKWKKNKKKCEDFNKVFDVNGFIFNDK